MSPTVRDIARRANVSASTVSRVLNNEPYVGESTRLAVRQAARELDYPLEHLRKAPQVKPRHSVILLGRNNVDDYRTASTSNIDSIIVAGAKEVFNRDYIAAHAYHVTSSFHEAQTLLNKVDKEGVLLLGGIVEHDFAAELQARNIPFVVAGAHLLPLRVNCVMADIINGMLQAVKHLVSRGVTRIGLANGPNTTNSSEEKYKGFRLALALHNFRRYAVGSDC